MCKEIEFRMTCSGCPEQYDVFDEDGNQIAYVRLRWGTLYCECPDCGGDTVYETYFNDGYKGRFDSEEERQFYLSRIRDEICKYYGWEVAEE